MATSVNAARKPHAMVVRPAYPTYPEAVFIAITSSDVPIASLIGTRASSTSAGTMRNPPPIPTMPVMAPTNRATRPSSGSASGRSPSGTTDRPRPALRNIETAAASITIASRASCSAPDMSGARMRAAPYEPAIATTPNSSAVFTRTFPDRQ